MAELAYTELQFLQAQVEIEEEFGTMPARWELSEGPEMDAWYRHMVGGFEKMAEELANHIAWLERQS